MSSVDERIVEMRFDNDQFEKAVKESLKTLDRLRDGLDLDSSAKSLSNLEKAVNRFSMDNIGDSAVRTAESFSLLYRIGSSFLDKLADYAVNTGLRITKALTIDNIGAGFNKYEQRLKSTQTIMNATGENIDTVEAAMEKLSWYTDETSYHFESMVSNVQSFTMTGQSLDESITSIIGIANACGYAGVEASKADHAMLGFSKAFGKGHMDAQSWSFIHTAGLDTKAMADQLIRAGLESGNLVTKTKRVNGKMEEVVMTSRQFGKQIEVTAESLQNTFSTGWLDNKTMKTALSYFGNYFDALYDEVLAGAKNADEAMSRVNATGMELGENAFKSAQVARTFSDAIEATKEAVSSQYSSMFNTIFGNYDQAKEHWTELSSFLWDVFAGPLDAINDSLDEWKDQKGFEDLFGTDNGAFYNFIGEWDEVTDEATGLYEYIKAIDEVLNDVFFDNATETFLNLSVKIRELSEAFRDSDKNIEGFKNGLYNVFSVIRSGFTILSAIGTYISKTFALFKEGANEIMPDLVDGVNNSVDSLADFADNLKKSADEFEYSAETVQRVRKAFRFAFDGIKLGIKILKSFFQIVKKVVSYIKPGLEALGRGFDRVVPYIESMFNYISPLIDQFAEWAESVDLLGTAFEILGKAIEGAKWLWEKGSEVFHTLFTSFADGIQALTGFDIRTISWDDVIDVLKRLGEVLSYVIPLLGAGATAIGEFVSAFVNNSITKAAETLADLGIKIQEFGEDAKSGTYTVRTFFSTLGKQIKSGSFSFKDFVKNLDIAGKIVNFFSGVKDKLGKVFENVSLAGGILSGLGTSLIILNLALSSLATNATWAFDAIYGVGKAVKKYINSMRRIAALKAVVFAFVASIIALVAAIGYLAYVAKTNPDALITARNTLLWVLGAILAFVLVIGVLSKIPVGASLDRVFFSMTTFAAALAALIYSLTFLEDIELKSMGQGLLALAIVIGMFIGAMALINKFSGKFRKGHGSGIWQMVGLAASVLILVLALEKLNNANLKFDSLEDLLSKLAPLLILIGAIAGLSLAVGNMRIGGVIAFVAMIFALKTLVTALEALSNVKDVDKISEILKWVTALALVIGAFFLLRKLMNKGKASDLIGGVGLLAALGGFVLAFVGVAFALKMLSTIDPASLDTLRGLLVAVGIIMTLLIVVAALMGSMSDTFTSGVLLLTGIAGSILLLAGAFYILASISNLEDIFGKVIGIFVILGVFAVALAAVSGLLKSGNVGMSVLTLAGSVLLLALAFRVIQGLDWDRIKEAGKALLAVMVGFAIMLLASSFGKGAQGAAKAILALAASVFLLAAALFILSFIKIRDMDSFVTAVGALIFTILAFSIMLNSAGKLTAKSIGPLIVMIFIIAALTAAIVVLMATAPSWQVLAAAAGALIVGLLAMAAALWIVGLAAEKFSAGTLLAAAAALVIAAIAVIGFAAALYMLKDIDPNTIRADAEALAILIVVMGVVLAILSNVAGGAAAAGAAMIVAAVGAIALAVALMALTDAYNTVVNKTPTNYTADWISGVANALRGGAAEIDGAASDLEDSAGHAAAAEDAVAAVAGGRSGGGRGKQGRGHEPRGTGAAAVGEGETIIGGDYLPEEMRRMAEPVEVTVPVEATPEVTTPEPSRSAGATLLDSFLSLFRNPDSIAAAQAAAEGAIPIDADTVFEPQSTGALGEVIVAAATGGDTGAALTAAAEEYIGEGMGGVDLTGVMKQALGGGGEGEGGFDATTLFSALGVDMSAIGEGGAADFISGLSSGTGGVTTAGTALGNAAISGVEEVDTTTAGANFAQGFADGISSNTEPARAAAIVLANVALSAIKTFLGIESPSKVAYEVGGFFDQGFGNAIRDYSYVSEDAATMVASNTIDALYAGLNTMDGIANGTLHTAPTIRPVMDASAIQNGTRNLDAMFSTRQAMYANIADQERRNNNDIYVLTTVAYAILDSVNSGHALYLDGNKLIGRINRGLGRL